MFAVGACGAGPAPPVRQTVFDPTAAAANAAQVEVGSGAQVETPYPQLDRAETPQAAGWIGVTVLRGGVRFARPKHWMIRDASLDPGHAYIQYISPSAYSFAIYERSDSPGDLWRDVQQRYENDVATAGAKVVGRHVPMATRANQGRAYTIERKTPAPSRSREYLVRSPHRVVLVQVVTQEADLTRVGTEVLDVLSQLEVL
jgi:hypothetical protein